MTQRIHNPRKSNARLSYQRKPCKVVYQTTSGPVPCKRIRLFFGMHTAASYVEVGGYDMDCPVSWFGDDALALRYILAGYENFISECFIFHAGSQSMKGVDQGEEQSKGSFWFSRKYRGGMAELEG